MWRFYKNITGCVGIAGYGFETIFVIPLKRNVFFVKLFETSFGSNVIASFTKFQCQGTETLGFIWVWTFEIHIQGKFLHNACILL